MSLNWTNLVSQGRAKSVGIAWTPEELEALITLGNERTISRVDAADFLRNGIMTPEDYDKAQAVKFVPKTIEQAQTEAQVALVQAGQDAISDVDAPAPAKADEEAATEDAPAPVLGAKRREANGKKA